MNHLEFEVEDLGIESVGFSSQPHDISFRPGKIVFDKALLDHQNKAGHGAMKSILLSIWEKKGNPMLSFTSTYTPEVKRFENCLASQDGVIQLLKTIGYGSHLPGQFFNNDPHKPARLRKTILFAPSNIPKYESVISIAGHGSGATWHFPAEALSALAAIEEWPDGTLLHINTKNKWNISWIRALPFDIHSDMIISGSFYSEELLIPRQGGYGFPYPEQIFYLRKIALQACASVAPQPKRSLVLVWRRGSRMSSNMDEIKDICERYAVSNGLEVILHDDQCLPELPDQLARFRDASIVVMPHGAAGILTVACNPGAHIIEFLNETCPPCFVRLSFYLGYTHHCLISTNGTLSARDLDKTLASLTLDSTQGL